MKRKLEPQNHEDMQKLLSKMAEKRAFLNAVLSETGASLMFRQDMTRKKGGLPMKT